MSESFFWIFTLHKRLLKFLDFQSVFFLDFQNVFFWIFRMIFLDFQNVFFWILKKFLDF